MRFLSNFCAGCVAGVVQQLAGGDEAEQLRSVRASRSTGEMPNSRGLKSTASRNAPRAGIGHIRRLGVGIEVVFGSPVRFRHGADAIDACLTLAQNRREPSAFGNRQPMPTIASGTDSEAISSSPQPSFKFASFNGPCGKPGQALTACLRCRMDSSRRAGSTPPRQPCGSSPAPGTSPSSTR